MSRYIYGKNKRNWADPSSKYGLCQEQFEKDIQAHQERYERKKETIEAMVHGLMKSDPVRQEETFEMFIEVLREWKRKSEGNCVERGYEE
ncbi:hypothetical protein [Caldibacillus thermoamylovorans]|uniref:hypothetical protein n=1 Tax=Caldibacillus thermoamylovorans TaxID=35841 RepID=UPI0005A427E8|nr:hypothetical protein [Caldibacillus thermoamylovorans]